MRMKRLAAFMLAAALACAAPFRACRGEETVSVRCEGQRFSTAVPAGYRALPDENGGLLITPGEPEDLPRVRIVRKDYPFNHPTLYLYTFLWEYVEAETGGDYTDEGFGCREAGGKAVYGSSFSWEGEDGAKICMSRYIGIREDTDTEFAVWYEADREEDARALLDTVVRNYREEEPRQPAAAKVLPLQADPAYTGGIDLQNGSFRFRAEDCDMAGKEGYFTAGLYEVSRFPEEAVRSLRPGDTILINGRVCTVTDVDPRDDEGSEISLSVREENLEESFGDFLFERRGSDYVLSSYDDWYATVRVGSVRVDLPLPEDFACYDVSGTDGPEPGSAEDFLSEVMNSDLVYLTQYNTECRLRDGRLAEVYSSSYPYGPTDELIP